MSDHKVFDVRYSINFAALAEAVEAGLDPHMLVNDAAEVFAAEAKIHISCVLTQAAAIATKLPELEAKAREDKAGPDCAPSSAEAIRRAPR